MQQTREDGRRLQGRGGAGDRELGRRRGLGRLVVESLLDHPQLRGLRRIMLATKDAHDLYRSYGFEGLDDPGRYMMRRPERP